MDLEENIVVEGRDNGSGDVDKYSGTTIRHLVVSGGGIAGFSYYGALYESYNKGIWDIENIQSMYGTSIGSIICVMLALKYDWQTLDDYIVKRPWQQLFKTDMYSILHSISKRGIFDRKVIEGMFIPLFAGKDISINVTMKEFFDITKIELHLFSTELNVFKSVDISYKTHPDWKVVDAVYSSSALPILFSPYFLDSLLYCDGGLLTNYPVAQCIENGANPNEIFGVCGKYIENDTPQITEESTLLDYMLTILNKSLGYIVWHHEKFIIGVEYIIPFARISISSIYNATTSMEERMKLIDIGKKMII